MQKARDVIAQNPWEQIGDRIWRSACQPARVNVGLIAGDDACLLVDTGCCPEHGRMIRDSIASVTDVPLRHVLVTHAHWDHWFGLAAFDDVESIGHASLAQEAERPEQLAGADELGVARDDVRVPSTRLTLMRALDLGNRRVELLHGGPAHTPGDVFAYVPDASVVFAGDLLEEGDPPGFGADSDLKNWAPALDVMMGLLNEHSVVVPGHGANLTHMDSFEQRARIGVIYPTVLDLVKQGVQREQAPTSAEWPYPDEVMAPALDLAYRQVHKAGIDPKRQLGLKSI